MTTVTATPPGIVPPLETVAPELVSRVRGRDPGALRLGGLAVGGIGIVASLALIGVYGSKQFYFSYLVAYAFVLALALGSLFFVLLHHATRAGWSVVVRRVAENIAATLPWLAILWVPIGVGSHTLYHHWMDPELVANDPILQGKQGYLDETFFFVRAGLYFLVWSGLATWFRRTSIRQDQNGDPALTLRMSRVAAPSLLLFGITLTFAAFDWLMSLNPHWFSTMWGVYYFAGSFMSTMALLALVAMWLERRGDLQGIVTVEHYHDIGKLMFAFVVFWTYIAFSQFMLIWYANLPEETVFYIQRTNNSWELVSELLIVGHFAIPFVFLMSRHIKRNRVTLAAAAVFLLLMQWVDMHWVVMPALHEHGVALTLMDLTTMVGAVGLFLGLAAWNMKGAPLIPERDPRLRESLAFENH